MSDPVVLSKNLKKYFESKKGLIKAVDGVNLSVGKGEIFGFLGPNGAGKTTTLRMLATLMVPTSGSITIAGYDVVKNPDEVRRHIGYVGQNGGSTGQLRESRTFYSKAAYTACRILMPWPELRS